MANQKDPYYIELPSLNDVEFHIQRKGSMQCRNMWPVLGSHFSASDPDSKRISSGYRKSVLASLGKPRRLHSAFVFKNGYL